MENKNIGLSAIRIIATLMILLCHICQFYNFFSMVVKCWSTNFFNSFWIYIWEKIYIKSK